MAKRHLIELLADATVKSCIASKESQIFSHIELVEKTGSMEEPVQ